MDYIMTEFADTIRKLAGLDRIIAARSAPGYIQMVMAPEVATLLVMEDMCVSEAQARVIMQESAGLGDLLNSKEEGDQRGVRPVWTGEDKADDDDDGDGDGDGDYWTKTQRVF
jgi:hypothetical protein